MRSTGNPTLWAIFAALVIAMLAADLGVFRRGAQQDVGVREAVIRSIGWILLAVMFNAGIYAVLGSQSGLEFTAAYLLEEALSVDNLFVFVLIFGAFRVPNGNQHRVLFWGIIGAIVLRGAFIGFGTALVQRFAWVMLIFGGLLVVTAWKLFRGGDDEREFDPNKNVAFRLFRKVVPSVPEFQGSHFVVRRDKRTYATPLLAVLVLVETSDVLFALDSIPAVFGVSKDPFIVYTSNIFAILGLRSLYFLLARVIHKFAHLKVGLAVILAFVGLKMIVHPFFHIHTAVSLSVIAVVLGVTIATSLLWPPRNATDG